MTAAITSIDQLTIADGNFMDANRLREARVGEQVRAAMDEMGIERCKVGVTDTEQLRQLAGISHDQARQVLAGTTSALPESVHAVLDAVGLDEQDVLAGLNAPRL